LNHATGRSRRAQLSDRSTIKHVVEPRGQLSPDGRWRWDGQTWIPTGFVGLEPKINSMAIASLVSALIFPLWPLSSIAGVVLGTISMRQLRERPSERGFGFAVAGLVIGVVVLVALGLVFAVALYFGHECRNGC
jgi:hypothetical protein